MFIKNNEIINSVKGVSIIVSEPVFTHYYDMMPYYAIEMVCIRDRSCKTDRIFSYASQETLEGLSDELHIGDIVSYKGKLVTSRVDKSLNDIAVLIESIKVLEVAKEDTSTDDYVVNQENTINSSVELLRTKYIEDSGNILIITGELRKICDTKQSDKFKSKSIIVKVFTEKDSYVIVKLTAVGRLINTIDKLAIGDNVYCVARIQSYEVKHRDDLKRNYIHDSILYSIAKLDTMNSQQIVKVEPPVEEHKEDAK